MDDTQLSDGRMSLARAEVGMLSAAGVGVAALGATNAGYGAKNQGKTFVLVHGAYRACFAAN